MIFNFRSCTAKLICPSQTVQNVLNKHLFKIKRLRLIFLSHHVFLYIICDRMHIYGPIGMIMGQVTLIPTLLNLFKIILIFVSFKKLNGVGWDGYDKFSYPPCLIFLNHRHH